MLRGRARRAWQGHRGPSGPASSESPPPPQGGTESSQARACRPAWRKQVHWNGFLLPPHLQKARVSSSNGQTCWKPPFPRDTHCPSAGHFAVCLAILTHGPESATRYWWPRVERAGESARPGSTRLDRVRSPSGPTLSQPTNLNPGASFVAGLGQSLGTKRYKCSRAHLRLPIHLCTRPARTLPTADTTEYLTLGGWAGWRRG